MSDALSNATVGTNERGQGMSHTAGSADNESVVPKTVQSELPESAERAVPNTLHNTGKSDSKSDNKIDHSHGDSIVPKKLAEVLPKKVEEVVPNVIHNTGPKQ